jgi:hypothetical protein
VLAGVALGLGLGAKLTTALAWPVLAWLAWLAGRQAAARAAAGVAIGLACGGVWGYVLNIVHTGHVLGHGQGRNEVSASPSLLGTLRTSAHLAYRLFDLSRLSDWLVVALAVAGALAVGVGVARRSRAFGVAALALLSPLATLAVIRLLHGTAGDPLYVSRDANEDYAAFGPLGPLALVGASVVALRRRSADARRTALALALPTYVVLLAVGAKYNIWITRFLLVPAVLVAPLFAPLFRWRAATAAVVVVAAIAVGLTLAHDKTKPLGGANGRPWNLTQASALGEGPAHQTETAVAAALTAYERLVPARACVGAVLDPDEPAYLLWGPKLRRRVFFLPSLAALQSAYADGLEYVVVSTGVNAPVSSQFEAAGWRLRPLGTYWTLGIAPPGHRGSCAA